MPRGWAIWLAVLFPACAGGLKGEVFRKSAVAYRVSAPSADQFHRVDFSDNDLAWAANKGPHLLAMNAVCQGTDDASLEVLTRHLLFGFTEKERLSEQRQTVDGREALHTVWSAKLDGVPMELELVVLKRDGCVHDFTYVSPPGERPAHQEAFDALVKGFKQEERN
ncbi:MAG: hypothetical protein IT380_23625 [Myxococcales bacterium]|nr:hypothetical protein [Myxococcales bacterium]